MSNQRLEGSDLEALLARVREEHGEKARIVEANKLRRGGVGGFFAKESFEVVVDLDDGQPEPAASSRPSGAPSRGEFGEGSEPAASSRPSGARSRGEFATDDHDDEGFVAFTLDELAASIDDPAPTFAAGEPWPDDEPIAATLDDADDDVAPTFTEVLGRAIAAERAAALEPAWPATAAVRAAAPAARLVAPRFEPGGLTGVAAPAAAVGGLSGADVAALGRLGLPLDHLALLTRTDDPAAVALVRLLEGFAVAPALPRAAQSVIAVIGGRDEAGEVAATLAGSAADVVVAADRRGADLRTAAAVPDLRATWRRRRRPVVVSVESPLDVAPSPWAMGLLDALEPALVLGHVDAGRKPEDVAAWSSAVGGIDALAVTGLDRTTTPAAILAAGIPVASLDGAPASPARWAALLTDRLTAAALAA